MLWERISCSYCVYILCQSTQAAPSVLTIIRAFFACAHRDSHNGHSGQIVNQSPVTMWQRNNMGKDIAKKIVDLTRRQKEIAEKYNNCFFLFGKFISRFPPRIPREIGCYFPIPAGNLKCGNLHSLLASQWTSFYASWLP